MGDVTNRHDRVLVVEDDADLACLLCNVFETLGAQSCQAVRSLTELQNASDRALEADLVVLDINLGAGCPSGVDAWRWLREGRYRGRVAFLTAHAASNPLVKSVAEQAEAPVLSKPVSMQTLAGLLHDEAHPNRDGHQ